MGRDVLFILPNGARLRRRNLLSKQVYSVGSQVKTSKGLMVVIRSGVEDGHEVVELRYHVPKPQFAMPICLPGSAQPTIAGGSSH